MAGGELENAAEQRLGVRNIAEAQVSRDRRGIDGSLEPRATGQQAFSSEPKTKPFAVVA
jgi:hypothetical protein